MVSLSSLTGASPPASSALPHAIFSRLLFTDSQVCRLYNESADFWKAVCRYHDRYGRWPERILADKIYRNRQTLSFCKERGIRLSGPALGKPPKDQNLTRQLKNQEYLDSCDRNAVEGIFATSKTSYGLDRISVRLEETTCCVIGVALLLMNLLRSLRSFLLFFLHRFFLHLQSASPSLFG